MTQLGTGWLDTIRQSRGTRLAAAVVDCRLGSMTNATESFQEVADRHGVDPYDLCALWLDDPTRHFASTKNSAREQPMLKAAAPHHIDPDLFAYRETEIPDMTMEHIDYERTDVQRLYRAIADGESTFELLQLVYDAFGHSCDLRPPVNELRLAGRCNSGARFRG